MRFAKALASGIFDGGRSMAGSIAAVVTRSSPDDHNVLSYLFFLSCSGDLPLRSRPSQTGNPINRFYNRLNESIIGMMKR
jgi:hypothetical protein